jgi:hypothetical protein
MVQAVQVALVEIPAQTVQAALQVQDLTLLVPQQIIEY